jgi:hypothetical protein
VISGNGGHGIPHNDTLEWPSEAGPGKEHDVFLTNRKDKKLLTKMLTAFARSLNEEGH